MRFLKFFKMHFNEDRQQLPSCIPFGLYKQLTWKFRYTYLAFFHMGISWVVFLFAIHLLFCSSRAVTVDVHAATDLIHSGHRYLDVSEGWTIFAIPVNLHDPRLLAMEAAECCFLEAEYDKYATMNASGAAFCRSAALIASDNNHFYINTKYLCILQVKRNGMIFLLRAVGFLLPCYFMAWAISILQRRRQRERNCSDNEEDAGNFFSWDRVEQIFSRLGYMMPPPLYEQINFEPLQPLGFLAMSFNPSYKTLGLLKFTAMVNWYLIASHTADYQHPMLFLNTLAVFVLVVAKFPIMDACERNVSEDEVSMSLSLNHYSLMSRDLLLEHQGTWKKDAIDLLLKASGYLEFCVRDVLVHIPQDIAVWGFKHVSNMGRNWKLSCDEVN
ncbi:hypothetical protein HHK36_025986 [Tetracentron sinense]|uniref:Uncharacterized protein n=1 Tax=Tetracentron sinense TaxID=13715 RepID=A0A835D3N2_TETSI|nr:hypothetical protein HHK36_025986 [Tetracentron sinense]